jgi:hypothetical protein
VILARGSTGDDVRTLQAALRSLGLYPPPARIDGDFGPKTEAAVMAFQSSRGLAVDGIVGAATWTALLRPDVDARAPYPARRCWPLRCLPDGRKPHITSSHAKRNPDRPKHYGVDLFYAYRLGDPPKKIGDSGRTPKWWIPENTYACATWDGRIVLADDSPTGMRAWLRHESGWSAGFFHLDRLTVTVGQTVMRGDPIGRVNDNPRDKGDADHLHFGLYWGDVAADARRGFYPRGDVDPELMLETGTPFLPADESKAIV